MEEEIRDRMADTQEKLLTNFDESVAERLKLNLINSNEMISKTCYGSSLGLRCRGRF